MRVYRRLGQLLTEAGYEGRLVGDEGGYGPRLPEQRPRPCEFVVRAIEAAGLRPGRRRDDWRSTWPARTSTTAWHYRLAATGEARLTSDELIDQLAALVERFPITSIEDPLAEDDWTGWQQLTARLGKQVRLVGDDLFATQRRSGCGTASSWARPTAC